MKIYKSNFNNIIFIFLGVIVTSALFPILVKIKVRLSVMIPVVTILALYVFLKKRVSAITINKELGLIIIETSFLLSKEEHRFTIESINILEYTKKGRISSYPEIFEIVANDQKFVIKVIIDGWSNECLNEIKEDVNDYLIK